MSFRVALAGALLAFLIVPQAAGAHLRSGTVAVDYRATVSDPSTSAYSTRIFQSDRALSITLRKGHTVVLVGYLGEPVFRLDGSGLWVNAASPTALVLRLVKSDQRAAGPGPRWHLEPRRNSVIWHDARTQGLPAGSRVGPWSVPLIVDGRRARLAGELQRFARPSLWPWLTALAALLVAAAVLLALRQRLIARRAATGLALAAGAAATVLIAAFALDAYASPGTWIECLDAIAFIGVGVWAALRGPQHLRTAGAAGTGVVALAVGVLEVPVFLHAIVLAVLPAGAVRALALVAIAAGVGAAAIGGVLFLEAAAVSPRDAAASAGFERPARSRTSLPPTHPRG
jgi:hypothetical protein